MQLTLTFVKINQNVAFYQHPGLKGSVRFLTSQFAGAPPATLVVEAEGFAEPKVKETAAERKARLATRTPQQVAQAALDQAVRAKKHADTLLAAAGMAVSA